MYGVNRIGFYTSYRPVPCIKGEEALAQTEGKQRKVPDMDTVISYGNARIGSEAEVEQDPQKVWEQAVEDCINRLKDKFPGLDINILDFTNKEQLAQYAAGLGDGKHIIISKEFLEGMAADFDVYREGVKFLEDMIKRMEKLSEDLKKQGLKSGNIGAAIDKDGKGFLWMSKAKPEEDTIKKLLDLLKDTGLSSKDEHKNSTISDIRTSAETAKLVYVKKLNYSAASNLSRLARLNGVSEVKSFIGGVRARINSVKSDKDLDSNQRKQAVAQMEGVMSRARTKVKNLEEENIIKTRGRSAAKQRQLELAEAHARELKRKRILRRSREYGQIGDKFPVTPDRYEVERELQREEDSSIIAGYGDQLCVTDMGSISGGAEIVGVICAGGMPMGSGVPNGATVAIAEVAQVINIG